MNTKCLQLVDHPLVKINIKSFEFQMFVFGGVPSILCNDYTSVLNITKKINVPNIGVNSSSLNKCLCKAIFAFLMFASSAKLCPS